MRSEFVLLDFDGVIVDTFEMCLRITREVWPDLTKDQYINMFKDDINGTLARIEASGLNFFKHYSKQILKQRLVPGIEDVLEFVGINFTTIIVSSTINEPIKRFLAYHGLTDYISAVFGNDVRSTKKQKFEAILNHYKLKTSECVFVTDTLQDIRDAKELDIPSIAVTWGYHGQSLLAQGDPIAMVDYPTQLKGAIEEALDFSGEYDEVH